MSTAHKPLLAAVIFSLLSGAAWAAPAFVPPSESAPPFRRDRLPIDPDSMVSLSRSLTLLSQSASMDEPAQRRATAQALALALALDPANSAAREVLDSITGENRLRKPDPEKLARAKSQIRELNGWLATQEAGADGNLLADLLGDTAATLDPDHPSSAERLQSGERGKWDGWVAPVAAFREREKVMPPDIAETDPDPPEKAPDDKPSSGLKSSAASIGAVLHWYKQETDSYILGPVTVSMEAKSRSDEEDGEGDGGSEPGNLRVSIDCHEAVRGDVYDKVSKPILRALAIANDVKASGLPRAEIRIGTGTAGTYSYRRNGDDMTGPGFILANAALTGIAPDAFFIADLDREGSNLELPGFFWKKLNTLADGSGGRLVVPASAEGYLTALLALEKPEFFLKYEVLLASSPKDAVRLCAKNPDAGLAEILAKFKEIKDKSTSAALGSYLANTHVRKRLAEISQAAPYHLSAKLLAIQGAGARPRAIDKKILAAEILEATEPLNAFSEMEIWEMNSEKVAAVEKAQESCRERLSGVERYAEMRDRELIRKAEKVIADLRSMIRIVRDRRELWEKGDEISRAHRTFRDANRDLRREMALLTGDRLPNAD